MFQTEPVLAIQSLANGVFTFLMVTVSAMGYAPFYIGVLVLITFGIHFRNGFVLIQWVLWTAFLTDILKHFFALPRPSHADVDVQLLGKNYPNPSPVSNGGAKSFFALPGAEATAYVRSLADPSFGFPSGHVSTTTVFWGGMARVFPLQTIRLLALPVIVLMAVSRMYLGRHFVGDVLGGFLLGLLVVTVCAMVLGPRPRWLERVRHSIPPDGRTLGVAAFLLVSPLVLAAVPAVDSGHAGRLFGLNAGYLWVRRAGFPHDQGSFWKRCARVFLALVLYLTLTWSVQWLRVRLSGREAVWEDFLEGAVPCFFMLWASVCLGSRWGWFAGRQAIAPSRN